MKHSPAAKKLPPDKASGPEDAPSWLFVLVPGRPPSEHASQRLRAMLGAHLDEIKFKGLPAPRCLLTLPQALCELQTPLTHEALAFWPTDLEASALTFLPWEVLCANPKDVFTRYGVTHLIFISGQPSDFTSDFEQVALSHPYLIHDLRPLAL